MNRTLSMGASALLLALALAFAAGAQSAPTRVELFTTVEIEGWDFSSYDEKIREAVTKAGVKGAGETERRVAARDSSTARRRTTTRSPRKASISFASTRRSRATRPTSYRRG